MRARYTCSAVKNFIDEKLENGWTLIQLGEGVLGWGNAVLLTPDDKHYNYVIREIYVNCWTSAHTVRRCRKISKEIQKEIDLAEEDEEE